VERIRLDIENSLEVTISAGVASYSPGCSDAELLRMADRALYRAKENGRNRVEVA
jgi:diguanylate cyclase (GGDEF)-like protein